MVLRPRGLDAAAIAIDVVSVVVAVVVGAIAGAILSFTHRQLPPWGLLLGGVLVAALLIGYRLAFGTRRHAAGAAAGLALAVGLFALPSPGGSVLVLADGLGYAWAFGAPFLAAVVVAWPRRRAAAGAAD